jgi:predicted dehydrogenase
VVGLRGRGWDHVRGYKPIPGVEVAYFCDVDQNVLAKRCDDAQKMGMNKPQTYTDFRKLISDKNVDAVSIATPNHWHSLMGIWAAQNGKDIYIEKPCSHNWWEGRQLVRAIEKYNVICEHGSQCRSSVAIMEAMDQMKKGLIGDVYFSRGLCYKWRDTIGRAGPEAVPAGVDYDMWTGPAPMKQFTQNRFHYKWHWIWDTVNGDLGNQGIHEVDTARWGLGVGFPTKVSAMGGHFMFDDDQETPNTLNVAYEFHEGGKARMMEFEVRHWMTNNEAGIGKHGRDDPNTIGNLFYGSQGYMAIDGYGTYKTYLGKKNEPGPSGNEPGNNWANFIDVLRTRDRSKQNAPIEEGALSVQLVHLANISYRTGRTLQFDADNFQVTGDEQANAMFTRNYRAPFVVPTITG